MKELIELKKFGEKANAMLNVSIGGTCPQILKLILLRDMVNFTINEIRQTGSNKSYKESGEFIKEFLKDVRVEVKNDKKIQNTI